MALNSHVLRLMIEMKRQGHLDGNRVMEIGAQQLSDSFLEDKDAINQVYELFGNTPPDLGSPSGDGPSHVAQAAPHARHFFKTLGFEYACIDIDGSLDAIPLDLNYDGVPRAHIGKYDLVTNCGTTEHIMNQMNAFKVVHDLTAPNGIMIHELPSQAQINHGLFNYHPKFFWMLARENDYQFMFFDYLWQDTKDGVPDDILDQISDGVPIEQRPLFRVSEAGITVALRKNGDTPFVPGIDVPTGSIAPNEVLERRYPKAFRQSVQATPGPFHRLMHRAANYFARI